MKKTFLVILTAAANVATANPYAAESAIYKIEVPYAGGTKTGIGTGVLIARDKILTNCHVMKPDGWPKVISRKTSQIYNVTSYTQLGKLDACVLSGGFTGTPVSMASDIRAGENVWLYGYPQGSPVVGQGSIIGMVNTDKGQALKLAAYCSGGSSGGPVLNNLGELIGLNWGTFQYQDNCLAIPVTFLKNYLR